LTVWDLSQPSNPQLLGRSQSVRWPLDLVFKEDLLLVGYSDSYGYDGCLIRALDVSDPSRLSELSRLELPGTFNSLSLVDSCCMSVRVTMAVYG
jgi:hypothetical protein